MTSASVAGERHSRPPTLSQMARASWADPETRVRAEAALRIFGSYCSQPMHRIPGCDTVIRLAIRIYQGKSIEEAAAREYSYRWHLFLDAWINHTETRSRSYCDHGPVIWQAPHLVGQ
ncbi:MAG: hypothetical protein EPO45_17220 [Sphingobium sp.]|nr:MAG: hypothetical protein EPO45_17220 [Sphingobium sp.]